MVRRISWNAAEERFLPQWVEELADWGPVTTSTEQGIDIECAHGGAKGLACVRLAGARDMEAGRLEADAARAYEIILRRLEDMQTPYPVRFWNFIPDIHRDAGNGRDRYMVFNSGRFAAFAAHYAGSQAFDHHLATASAVGYDGMDLLILCLARAAAGQPVDNPRQIQAYRYSPRFGPRPPCFARGMVIDEEGRRLLLAGGTASIVGEESTHAGDLKSQFDETLENLASLVRESAGSAHRGAWRELESYRELRVYHPRKEDESTLRQWLASAMPNVHRLEVRQASLCRAELLVEIEGVADLSGVRELAPAQGGRVASKTGASSRTP